jgi:hypothetical protein
MAIDLDAREATLNYDGGSLTMTIGNLKNLFDTESNSFGADGQAPERAVRTHDRVRVIGGDKKRIEGYTYDMIQWPVNGRSNAAGGKPIVMTWEGSEGSWQARVTGSLWELGTFLQKSSPKLVWFHTKGGKGYGPFQKLS